MISSRNLPAVFRRAALLIACSATGLLGVAGFAAAATIEGGPLPETLVGTAKGDQIFGRGGGDSLFGRGDADQLVGGPGGDTLNGGPDRDTILGGPGSDRIFADDGFADSVDCGSGWDIAVVDELDTVAANCEVVKRKGAPAAQIPTATLITSPTAITQAETSAVASEQERAREKEREVERERAAEKEREQAKEREAEKLGREAEQRERAEEKAEREVQQHEREAERLEREAERQKHESEQLEREAEQRERAEEKLEREVEQRERAEEKLERELEQREREEEIERSHEPLPVYEEQPLAMFPENNGWTGNGIGTYEDVGAPFIVNGDRSYKIETDGEENESVATSPLLEPVDLTASHVSIQGEVSFSAHLGEVRLRLASGDIAADYAEATVWREGRDPTILGSTFEYQSIPTGGFTVHGTVDWSQIDRAQLVVTDNGTGTVSYYAAGIYAIPTYRTPTISFAFDDSLASTFTLGLKKLSAYRIPASEYVIANAIGTPGFLTEEQLYTMRNLDNWEIGGHAFTLADHNEPRGLDSLTPEQLKADFDGMREWMGERGFKQRTFAFPQGAAGPEVRKYAQRDYCAARVTAEGPETIPPRNPFVIRGTSIDSSETHLPELEATVRQAIAEKSWLVLTFHNLVTGPLAQTTDFSYQEFGELVDYVEGLRAEGALQVRTVADAVGC